MKTPVAACLILLFACNLHATVINVPGEYRTLQAGIEAASAGDTVLAAPRTYTENIDFLGKSITVASRYITTGDRDMILNTIIDGNHEGPCVLFEDVVHDDAVLDGFTVQNGLTNYGGGISAWGSVATIRNCFIRWNVALDFGGGVASLEADIFLENCIIRENETDNGGGGGVYLGSGHSALYRCEISYNSADIIDGGGIYCEHTNPFVTNCTIAYNVVDSRGGGIYFTDGTVVTLRNSVFWGNSPQQLWLFEYNRVTVLYCLMEGGQEDIEADDLDAYVWWEEGNFDAPPRFVNRQERDLRPAWDSFPVNDEHKSPLIDAGDPDSPLDPDVTRADIGAHYFEQTPIFEITPDTIFFNPVRPGFYDWQEVIMTNLGGGTIQIIDQSIHPEGPPFGIERGGDVVALVNGNPHHTWLSFFPPRVENYEAVFRVETDDDENPVTEIVLIGPMLGVDPDDAGLPHQFILDGIYPNPFNSTTTISYRVPSRMTVDLRVWNLKGIELAVLQHADLDPGLYRATWDASDQPPGVYLVSIGSGQSRSLRKAVLIR